jgi:hypothetical protein
MNNLLVELTQKSNWVCWYTMLNPRGLGLDSCDANLNQCPLGWVGTKNHIMEPNFCYNDNQN